MAENPQPPLLNVVSKLNQLGLHHLVPHFKAYGGKNFPFHDKQELINYIEWNNHKNDMEMSQEEIKKLLSAF